MTPAVNPFTPVNNVRTLFQDLSMEEILRVIAKNPQMENAFKKEITKTFFNQIPWKGNWSGFLEKAPPIAIIHLKCLLEGLTLLGRNYFPAEEKDWGSEAMAHLVTLEILAKKSTEYNWKEAVPHFKEYLEFLDENGFNANQLDDEERKTLGSGRPLHFAAFKGCAAICKSLRLLGAWINLSEREKGTIMPLHLAARNGDLDTVEILMELKADVNALVFDKFFWPWYFYGNGSNPLCFAKDPKVIEILVKKGADQNHLCGDNKASTPLEHAILDSNYEGAKILVESGAKPHIHTKQGNAVALAKQIFENRMENNSEDGNAKKEIKLMKDAYSICKLLKKIEKDRIEN